MEPRYIAQMEPDTYLGYVYPDMVGLTQTKASAMRFRTRRAAREAIRKAKGQRPGEYEKAFVTTINRPDVVDQALALHDPGSRRAAMEAINE